MLAIILYEQQCVCTIFKSLPNIPSGRKKKKKKKRTKEQKIKKKEKKTKKNKKKEKENDTGGGHTGDKNNKKHIGQKSGNYYLILIPYKIQDL